MKKVLLALLVAVLAATSLAWAAEGTNWSGFYFGINAGLARHEPNWSDNDDDWFGGTLTNPYYTILPGGALGYNKQFGSLVFGFEVDGAFGFMENKVDYSLDWMPVHHDVTKTDKLKALITVRARMGFAIDSALFYLTAGAGLPLADHTWIESGDPNDSWPTFTNSNPGMVVGLGFEHRLNRNLAFKAEFLSFNNSPKVEANTYAHPYSMSVDDTIGMLRVGFNILF